MHSPAEMASWYLDDDIFNPEAETCAQDRELVCRIEEDMADLGRAATFADVLIVLLEDAGK